jgi:aminoglycoside phosphotransferase (APT) family kinase protein
MTSHGRLIASGRDSDIFAYAPGLVLRHSRQGRSMEDEARVMEFVRQHRYPVPAIEELSRDGTELIMERIEGPSMVAAMERRPWSVRRQARVLADLHRQLHDIPAPDFLPAAPVGAGDRMLHLDLHPLNVILGPRGPVVIDWPNASAGDPAVDVALTWALSAAGEIPASGIRGSLVALLRTSFVNAFLGGCDRRSAEGQLREVIEWKMTDPHMAESEQRGMRVLLVAVETDARATRGRAEPSR